MKIIGREVIYQQGCYSRQNIWYEGHIRGINGIWTWGWQGEPLTKVTVDVIKPIATFEVKGAEDDPPLLSTDYAQ